MDPRILEMSDLFTRIIQLERLQELCRPLGSTAAIEEHLEKLRKRLLELKSEKLRRHA